MKKLQKLFTEHPGYTKWGNARIAKVTGLKEITVKRFKSKDEYKELKKNYIVSLTKVN